MSQVEFHYPVQNLHGKLNKRHSVIMRQKKYRSETGAVLREGVQESYTLYNPREPYEKRPKPGSRVVRRKQYSKLDNFIQAIMREKLRLQTKEI